VKLGRICGYEIIDGAMETEYVPVQTPPKRRPVSA